jgi:hypothetical protein
LDGLDRRKLVRLKTLSALWEATAMQPTH